MSESARNTNQQQVLSAMKHPTKQQVQVVLDNFEKVLPAAKRLEDSKGESVYMMETCANHSCKTPMCHGGWYQVAIGQEKDERGYSTGAHTMAVHLGFTNTGDLKSWAGANPEIWGNRNGVWMFSDGSAFDRDSDSLTLQKIVDHWKGVQERLPV